MCAKGDRIVMPGTQRVFIAVGRLREVGFYDAGVGAWLWCFICAVAPEWTSCLLVSFNMWHRLEGDEVHASKLYQKYALQCLDSTFTSSDSILPNLKQK